MSVEENIVALGNQKKPWRNVVIPAHAPADVQHHHFHNLSQMRYCQRNPTTVKGLPDNMGLHELQLPPDNSKDC